MMRSLALLVCAFSLPAAELVVRDLRVAAGSRPTGFDFSVTSPTREDAGSDAFDVALGLEVGGRWSFTRPGDSLGLVVGADAMSEGYAYASGGKLGVTAVRGAAGLGWALSDRWTMTGEVGVSSGLSLLDLPASSTVPAFSASGTVFGYDARIGATWLATRRFGVGMHAGWMIATHNLTGDDVTMTLDQSGWFIGVEAIWRFTDAPTRLE